MFIRKQDPIVSCVGCSCLIKEKDAHIVKIFGGFGERSSYCRKCKPDYDEIIYSFDGRVTYTRLMICDRDGNPIGYIKKK